MCPTRVSSSTRRTKRNIKRRRRRRSWRWPTALKSRFNIEDVADFTGRILKMMAGRGNCGVGEVVLDNTEVVALSPLLRIT